MAHPWLALLIAALVKALLHGALELVGNLSVTITMENAPSLQRGLAEHLALNLTVDLTHVLLDVKRDRSTTWTSSHEKLASLILVSPQLLWSFSELQVPELLLLLTLRVGLEVLHQVLDLFDLGIGVGMNNLG